MLTTLSALAEFPARIQFIIINDESNSNGIYSVRMYLQGVLTEMIIDDNFPCLDG